MKKITFPIGTAKAGRLLGTSTRTIRTWCNRLKFSHIDPEKELSPFQILNEKQLELLKSKLHFKSGNPNWVKSVK